MASEKKISELTLQLTKFNTFLTLNIPGFSTIDQQRSRFISDSLNNLPFKVLEFLSEDVVDTLIFHFEKYLKSVEDVMLTKQNIPELVGRYQSQLEEFYNYIISLTPLINSELNKLTQSLIIDLEKEKEKAQEQFNQNKERLRIDTQISTQQRKEYEKLREELLNKFNEALSSSEKDAIRIEELKKTLENQSSQFEERLTPILRKGELFAQGINFRKTAQRNFKVSFLWIGIITILIFILVFFINWVGHLCLDFKCFNDNNISIKATSSERYNLFIYYLIRVTLSTLLIISLLIYLLKFAVKNYNAVMHNHTINSHKANAFAASLNLIENVIDPGKKAEIVNLAAKEIFSQQKTGYLSKDNDISISALEKISNILK